MATDKESLIVRLRAACNGHPCATIAWPHRILHEAADELTAANARIAELEALLGEAPHSLGCASGFIPNLASGDLCVPCNCFKSRA